GVGWLRESRAALEERVNLLARTRRELRSDSMLGDTVAVLRRRVLALAPKILAGGSSAEAANDLAGRMNLIVTRSNGRLLRADPVGDSTTAGLLGRVTLAASFEADVRGVTAVLSDLGSADPALAAASVRVLATNPHDTGPGPEVLRTELLVRGWYLRAREGE
ncbi:MAG: GspMb/PilO family protein, partial [Gemmatimonadales bacterium]